MADYGYVLVMKLAKFSAWALLPVFIVTRPAESVMLIGLGLVVLVTRGVWRDVKRKVYYRRVDREWRERRGDD